MIKKLVLGFLLVCIALPLTGSSIILFTQSGLRASIALADKFLPGELSVEAFHGRLGNQFELQGVRYSDNSGIFFLKHFSFGWRPLALLERKVSVTSFLARGIAMNMLTQAHEPDTPDDVLSTLSHFVFPVTLHVEKGVIESVTVLTDDEQQKFEVSSINFEDLSAVGNLVEISSCTINSNSMEIGVKGQLQISERLFTDLDIEYTLNSTGKPSVTGKIMLKGTTEQLGYEASIISPAAALAKGSLYKITERLRWDVQLLADDLLLSQFEEAWPAITMNDLQVSGNGETSLYSFQVSSKASYKAYQDISVLAEANGEASTLQFDNILLSKQEMKLQGDGTLTWDNGVEWHANLNAHNIDPLLFDSRLPGRIAFDAAISGQTTDEGVRGTIDLQKMDGEIRGYPIKANGNITVEGDNISVKRLYVQSAESVLNINGNVDELIDLEFNLNSPDLEAIWPDLCGSLSISGALSGSRNTPAIQFDIAGNEIQYNELLLGQLTGTAQGSMEQGDSMAFSLNADDVALSGTKIEAIDFDLQGNLKEQVIGIKVTAPEASADLRLEGGYSEKHWTGFVGKGGFKSDKFGEWQLNGSAPLKLSFAGIELQNFCLVDHESASICFDGKYSDEVWSSSARIEAFPLGLFDDLQYKFEEISGVISGIAVIKGKGSSITNSELELSTDGFSSRLTLGKDYDQLIIWKSCLIRVNTDEKGASIELSGILDDGSKVTAEGVLTDIDIGSLAFRNAGFEGKIAFDIKDLSPLSAISYPTVQPSGTLVGNITMAGKLMQPELLGNVILDQGKLIFPDQGITVEDIVMQVEGLMDRLKITLRGVSGDGTLSASGIIPLMFDDDEPVTLQLSGDNFKVYNSPDVKVNVSPELELRIGKEEKELRGQLMITEALIAPTTLKGVVLPSKDVVFVHDEAGDEEDTLPLLIDIIVTAGEKVKVRAFGLKGMIEGQLHIVSMPYKPVRFEGSLAVREGTYSIYGRQLNIVQGQLLYSANPPDNPGIELRAENTASGVTTGIEVSGFLQEPEVGFYSTPAMEKDEIIKRLLLNTSLVGSSEEEGFLDSVTEDTGMDPVTSAVVGLKESLYLDDIKIESGKDSEDLSLVIGSWLTPKLYVSYGQNLLKESGSFNTKYDLGSGFFLETETGTTESGVDLIYELNR